MSKRSIVFDWVRLPNIRLTTPSLYGPFNTLRKVLNCKNIPLWAFMARKVWVVRYNWSPRKSVIQSAFHYDVTSRVSDFQNGKQRVIEGTDKDLEFIKEILFRFLEFENFKIPIVLENQTLVHFWNETSSGVMNFKDSCISSSQFYRQLYGPVTLLRAMHSKIEEFRHSMQ